MDTQGKSAGYLGRAIGAGKLDPLTLTEAFLDAAETHEHGPRIYAHLTRDRALAEATAARDRARTGHRLSLLDGVPISWKDLFDTAGVATEAGSALLAGRVPQADALVLRNTSAAGLVCLGKTHLSELAFSGLGYNPVTASTPCVNDPEAVSGGSSSGAAGSVAFGLAAAAIGSDTGGSVRVPAGWNDLVGLQTTSGRLSLQGMVPLCARFDTVGPLTRTVDDAALLLAALEGGKPADLRGASLKGVNLANLTTVVQDDLDPTVAAAHHAACDRLRAVGAKIIDFAFPRLTEAMALAPILYPAEAYGTWKDTIEAAPDKMFSEILERFRSGASVGAADYVAAWHKLNQIRAEWNTTTAGFDAVMCPTVPNLPPKLAQVAELGEAYKTANLLTLRNTRVSNLMGLCTVNLPTGTPSCGVSLMGKPMGEEAILRIASGVELQLKE
jgi:aspartyl-tRNA(Asn)/glutamyl-tRNA(Gln) amidotransferase subunit A